MKPPTDSPSSKLGYSLRLDDAAVEQVVSAYPEEVRADVRWLATYVSERCNRQLSVLEGIVRKQGFATTANVFYKIFTGKYFVPDPKRPGKVIGSIPNFQQIIGRLSAAYRIERATGAIPFIETPTWTLISDYIDVRREPDRVCKFGVIIGPTGAQKTACFKEVVRRNNHGKTVHIEAPHTPSMSQFITDLAARYNASVWSNQENKLRQIYAAAMSLDRTIIVDNVQRLYNPKAAGNQPIFNFLQKLQDDSGCTVILSFTPDFERVLTTGADKGYFEQFEGRCGGRNSFLKLADNAEREDVLTIARSFGLAVADKGSDIEYLETLAHAKGRIRILFTALQEGAKEARAANQPFSIAHVRAVRGETGK